LPVHETIKDLAVLIVLALQEKIYSYQGVQFDLLSEIASQEKAAYPLIEEQITFGFERDAKDNSNHKYVLNAEYWLRKWLSRFAKEERYSLISQAFSYIMGKILKYNGDVTIDKTDNKLYREYIWFDNINAIFNVFNDNRILLIKLIYDDLRPILSMEPSYNHQKAKGIKNKVGEKNVPQNVPQNKKELIEFIKAKVRLNNKITRLAIADSAGVSVKTIQRTIKEIENLLYFGSKTTQHIYFKITFGTDAYECQLSPSAKGTLFVDYENVFNGKQTHLSINSRESVLKDHQEGVAQRISAYMRTFKNYHFHDTSENAPLRKPSLLSDNLSLREDGGNLPSFLYYLQEK